jgi:poly(3-hydroxybutyrate) depolymerase
VLHDLEQRRVVSGSNPLFLIGVSNGGGMVLEAAKQWPERVTGIAPFMAFDGFEPSPIPDLGESPLERVFFGYAPGDPGLPQGYVDDVLSKLPIDWAKALGLSDAIIAAPAVEQLPDRVEEGAGYTGSAEAALATRDSRATRYDYGGPSDGRRVRLLVFENAGHFWPNPVQDSEDWILQRWGFRNQDVDASAEVWDFFRDALEAP